MANFERNLPYNSGRMTLNISRGFEPYYLLDSSFPHRKVYTNVCALHIATYYGLDNLTHALLGDPSVDVLYDIDINLQSHDGNTALTYAATRGHTDIVCLLLERSDIDINLQSNDDNTALTYAALGGHTDVVRLLLERSDIELSWKNTNGNTTLMCIAAFLDEDVVRRLLELRDIDINTQDNEGDTALMCAIHDGNPVQLVESVHLVLERHDIDVNLQSNDGMKTPY